MRTSLALENVEVSLSNASGGSSGINRLSKLDSDLNFEELETSAGEQATALFRRGTMVEATWDDFELMAVIGKGTFGKVYLVSCKPNGKYYAMKCIRKDVVIKHESVESLAVEKLILN